LPTIKTNRQRDVLKILNENKLQSRPFWVPMNQLPMFTKDIFYNKNDRSNFVYKHCLSIPCSTNITDQEMEMVTAKIKEVYK
jgi:perosamine synthetase